MTLMSGNAITRMDYTHDGNDYSFILDLSKLSARDRLIRTAQWASMNHVEIQLLPCEIRTVEEFETIGSQDSDLGVPVEILRNKR